MIDVTFKRLILSVLFLLALTVAACQPGRDTQYLLEVTSEVTRIVVVTATPEGTPPSTAVAVEPTVAPSITPSPTESPPLTVEAIPTPISDTVVVAEQEFEGGRMFYIQPRDEIWVLIEESPDRSSGRWTLHNDDWVDGMPETDPEIVPPEDRVQPIRGFGKLWRENTAIRDALGWALDTEFGHWTTYQYVFGGEINGSGVYVPGPGQHAIVSRDGDTFILNEDDGSWQRIPNDNA